MWSIRRFFRRLFGRSQRERLWELHRLVLKRFPDTAWVHAGEWCWFASQPGAPAEGTIVYPYIPLVLMDVECSRAEEVVRGAAELLLPVVRTDVDVEQFEQLLTQLERRGGM